MSRPGTPQYAVRRPPVNSSSNTTRSTTPTVRNVMTLEKWESLCPLTDEQVQSIGEVKERLGQRPLPSKFSDMPAAESSAQGAARASPIAPRPSRIADLLPPSSPRRPQSPAMSTASSTLRSNVGTPVPGQSSNHFLPDPLHPMAIATPQQFHDHFSALTLFTEHEQDSLYRDHLAEVTALREKCDDLIEVLQGGEVEVGEMLKFLAYVEERSESLRGACEDLLEEQTHLLTHTSQLAHRLTFFTFLDTAQRTLNTPDADLVLSENFLPMVKRLEECLGYLGEHRDFKDSELFLIRYQQCMTRSMALIRIHFVNTIRNISLEVNKRMNDKSLSETAIQALIYTKFTSLSPSLRPLVAELEYRASLNPDELNSLLAECHSAWVSARQSLVGPRVAQEIGRMDPDGYDLVDLTRAGCSYLKSACQDEFNLYKHFFLSGEPALYGFLESLCDYLYDHIRPRILHEPSLETLCGVCTVLQALMVKDVASYPADEDPDEVIFSPSTSPFTETPERGGGGGDYFFGPDESFTTRQGRTGSLRGYSGTGLMATPADGGSNLTKRENRRKPLARLHIEVLLRMVLQDAQTRLAFRAQAMLRADVELYAPKDEDLDYPAKVASQKAKIGQRQLSISLDPDDDDEPAFLSLPPTSVQDTWYPTLRSTLWILSCLYTYVEGSVFEDLAQEAVVNCRRSLSSASEHLAAKKNDKTLPIDAKLFLVRHLLILKEMTGGLELGRRDRHRDWRGISDFLRSLLDTAGTMLGYGRGAIIRSGEALPDAKTDVDQTLKLACEDLIQICTADATAPLTNFLEGCTVYLSSRSSTTSDLSSQVFATPEEVQKAHKTFKNNLRTRVNEWKAKLMLYLQDEETVKVLLPPTYNSIVDAYRKFHDLIRAEYDFSTASSVMTPSSVHNLLLEGQENHTNGAASPNRRS
ncbi:Sec34-like family-domain-containing protein [Kockovaella imperatae]|uniref:Conserved oligomeric Golgi complex subunit 3 n=1 Tax=Kockovaella imperatae TaxID=4999 RepID=A0A1Y1UKD1_9TREE|nr:Sec34-like family-domain-containing protein [Kockovaella imperatae]ORX38511.1 Sec34-like family-domain-containing protein [Kockovaella imperatae]